MDTFLLLLAQDNAPVPDVDKAIDWASRASQLGVAGLALFIMFLSIFAVWYYMRKNGGLHHEVSQLNEKIAAQEASKTELERGFREKVEALLREMLERGEDSHEALGSNTQAVRDMTIGMQQLTTRIEYVERALHPHPRPGGGGA